MMTNLGKSDVPDVVDRIVAQALDSSPGEATIALRPPLDHQNNHMYDHMYDVWCDDRHLIAKEYLHLRETPDAPDREFRALRLLASLDVAPRPVFYEPALGPIVVYEYLKGEMWDRRKPTAEDLARLTELWLKIAAIPSDGLWTSRGYQRPWGDHVDRLHDELSTYARWADATFAPGCRAAQVCTSLLTERDRLFRDFAAMPRVLGFGRSDPRFANVIRRPNGSLAMVDWELSGRRDPAIDLADLQTYPNQEDLVSPAEWRAFLDPYLAGRAAVDPAIAERVERYLALFPVFWLTKLLALGASRASQGSLAEWTINGLPANQRLRRYLARALAWPCADFEERLAGLSDVTFFAL